MLKKEDLLQFTKNVELAVTLVEDDSSDKTEEPDWASAMYHAGWPSRRHWRWPAAAHPA